jgi:hypothetical protein
LDEDGVHPGKHVYVRLSDFDLLQRTRAFTLTPQEVLRIFFDELLLSEEVEDMLVRGYQQRKRACDERERPENPV